MTGQPLLRVLIVDDEPDILDVLSQNFADLEIEIGSAMYPVEIVTALRGAEALMRVEAGWFDVIIADIQMPKMTGLEFLAALRGGGHDNPVIILTAFGDAKNSAEALRLGCYAFVDKPCAIEKLRKVLVSAAIHGFALRSRAMEVEKGLKKFTPDQSARKSQLRTVLRSVAIGNDGSHRADVCPVPAAHELKKKFSRGS